MLHAQGNQILALFWIPPLLPGGWHLVPGRYSGTHPPGGAAMVMAIRGVAGKAALVAQGDYGEPLPRQQRRDRPVDLELQ